MELPVEKLGGPAAFYMVHRDGGGSPTRKFERYEEALLEAKRLCKKESAIFFVTKSITLVRPADIPVEVIKVEDDDGQT